MAKLTGPFFSLGASGAIAKTLVAFPWKGINCLRKYVVPANPNTLPQQTQRGYVKAAVPAIHAAVIAAVNPLVLADKVAYSLLGSTFPSPRTWFNQIVKNWIDVAVAGNSPCIFTGGHTLDDDKDDFRPQVFFKQSGLTDIAAGKFYLATTKTAVIATKVATINPAVGASLDPAGGFDGLQAGLKYYWWFKPDTGDDYEGCESGIYYAVAT